MVLWNSFTCLGIRGCRLGHYGMAGTSLPLCCLPNRRFCFKALWAPKEVILDPVFDPKALGIKNADFWRKNTPCDSERVSWTIKTGPIWHRAGFLWAIVCIHFLNIIVIFMISINVSSFLNSLIIGSCIGGIGKHGHLRRRNWIFLIRGPFSPLQKCSGSVKTSGLLQFAALLLLPFFQAHQAWAHLLFAVFSVAPS